MRARSLFALFGSVFVFSGLLAGRESQVVVEDTGSTNRTGIRVVLGHGGQATIETDNHDTRQIKLSEQLCNQLLEHLKAVGPLSSLPTRHCVKSVSFGSKVFVEYNGARSPDLSCPGPEDPALASLTKSALDVLQNAREASGITGRRIFSVPRPAPK